MAPGGSLSRKREDVTIKRRVKIFRQEATHTQGKLWCDASFLVFFTHTFTRGTRHFFRGIYFSGKTHFVRQSFVSTLSKKRKNEAQKARKKAEAHLIRVEDWLQKDVASTICRPRYILVCAT